MNIYCYRFKEKPLSKQVKMRYLSYKEIQTIRNEIKRLEKRLDWLDTSNYFERGDFIEDIKKVEYIKEILEERHGRTRA